MEKRQLEAFGKDVILGIQQNLLLLILFALAHLPHKFLHLFQRWCQTSSYAMQLFLIFFELTIGIDHWSLSLLASNLWLEGLGGHLRYIVHMPNFRLYAKRQHYF
jgi:hypothetical protein